MGIYIFFGAVAASIFGFSFLRNKWRNNENHLSPEEQAIIRETEQELKAGETSNGLHEEGTSSSQGSSLEDETAWPQIGQLPANSNIYTSLVYDSSAVLCSTQQVVTNGFKILCEALYPREHYKLDFSTLSSSQTVITLDYRDNAEGDSGVILSLLNAPTEPITLQICGSEVYRSFFKEDNRRFVVVKNDSSRAFLLYLVVQNYSSDKRKVIASTKFQPVVISAFEILAISYFEAEQVEGGSSKYVALARQLSSAGNTYN